VISHRQNDVLRVLTIFSVTLLPLTVITGIFGMNVLFPGEGTEEAFWTILASLAVVLLALLAFFRLKRWL
jgi:magnesium transporter